MAKILIVDDEPLICDMLAQTLVEEKHEVFLAVDGVEALQRIGEVIPDLMIVDIVMPEMDGLEAISQAVKLAPKMKIIAMSGGPRIGDTDFLAVADKLGASATFQKPLDNDSLLEKISQILMET